MNESPFPFAKKGEWDGYWWLPENPDNKVAGTLIYDGEGGLNLKLDNHFDGYNPDEVGEVREDEHGNISRIVRSKDLLISYDVIYGVADGVDITIMDARDMSPIRLWRRTGSSYASDCKINAEKLILGKHLENKENKVFNGLRVSVDNLGCWDSLEGGQKFKFSALGKSIEICGVGSSEKPNQRGPFCQIISGEDFSLHEALEEVKVIQNFISFVVNQFSDIVWMQLQVGNEFLDLLFLPVKIGVGTEVARGKFGAELTSNAFPIDISLSKWFELANRAQAAISMVIVMQFEKMPFVENDLLTVTMTAEVLHRNLKLGERPYVNKEFKLMREKLLEVAPDGYKEMIKSSIRNELTLRQRLVSLADFVGEDLISALIPDVEYWAKEATKARNYLTHEGKVKNQSVEELIAIVDVTKAVVVLSVMRYIGVSDEYQKIIVSRHRQFIKAVLHAREWLMPPSEEITEEKQKNTDA
jgi:hypothetical protein